MTSHELLDTSTLNGAFKATKEAVLARFPPQSATACNGGTSRPSSMALSSASRRPRKSLAVNTELAFKSGAEASIGRGFRPASHSPDVHQRPSTSSRSSSSTPPLDTNQMSQFDSLAQVLWASGRSSSDPDSIRRAMNKLPIGARPFQYQFNLPPNRNIYAPKWVEGQGLVSAFHDRVVERVELRYLPLKESPRRERETRQSARARNGDKDKTASQPGSVHGDSPAIGAKSLPAIHPPARPAAKGKGHSKSKAAPKKAPAVQQSEAAVILNAGAAKKKRSRPAEDDGIEDEHDRADDVEMADPEEEETSRTTRSSKRRKTDMPPPATVPAHARKTTEASEVEEDAEEQSTRRTRSSRRSKESTASAETAVDNVPAENEVVEKVTVASRSSRAKIAEKAESSAKKSPPRKSTSPSYLASNSTAQPHPTHSYSTRRAGTRNSSTHPESDKHQASPTPSDDTLVQLSQSSKSSLSEEIHHQPTSVAVA